MNTQRLLQSFGLVVGIIGLMSLNPVHATNDANRSDLRSTYADVPVTIIDERAERDLTVDQLDGPTRDAVLATIDRLVRFQAGDGLRGDGPERIELSGCGLYSANGALNIGCANSWANCFVALDFQDPAGSHGGCYECPVETPFGCWW